MKQLSLLLIAAMVAFAACSKSENPPQESLYTKVLGKWSLNGVSLQTQSNGKKADAKDGFIEFLSDSTFYIYDAGGQFFTGKFSIQDGASISLENFATIRSLTFSNTALNFILMYNGKEITIAATKAPTIALTDSTTLICKNWHLTREGTGGQLYEAARGLFDAEGNPIGSFVPDSVTFRFTTSGTYLVQMFKEKQLKSVDVFNWKWHSSLANHYVCWDNSLEFDEEKDKVEVLELNKNAFRSSQSPSTWGFVPAEK
ncbi:hypothetical protein MKQ68_04370 [Chitinophaga horti]|uniref:Lipocalin-like domain-containing protein n=1 Tax=Chitinophaga horti TaxID=2920382 RepID=A0ABY6J3T3_9BACT|nr:hypothetical protein [Chitinophaga horti]UYQ94325.1 hypothetical protein MKQ68_04370 [Chitinophaga horti]